MLRHRPRYKIRVEQRPMGYQGVMDETPFRRINLWQLMKLGCGLLLVMFSCGIIAGFLLSRGGDSDPNVSEILTLTSTAIPTEIGNISFDWTATPTSTASPTHTPSVTPSAEVEIKVEVSPTPNTPPSTQPPMNTYTPYPTYTPSEPQIIELIITSAPEVVYQESILYQEVVITSPPEIQEVVIEVVNTVIVVQPVIVTATPLPTHTPRPTIVYEVPILQEPTHGSNP